MAKEKIKRMEENKQAQKAAKDQVKEQKEEETRKKAEAGSESNGPPKLDPYQQEIQKVVNQKIKEQ